MDEDPTDFPGPEARETSLDVDVTAFLPEGVELAADDDEAGSTGRGGEADDEMWLGDADSRASSEDRGGAGSAGTRGEPGVSDEDDGSIDTALLEKIEAELNEVDAALTAIDADELEASPLLRRLLGE